MEQYPQLSLAQVAAFAEFDDDPQACEQLEGVLAEEPEQFDHLAAELRQTRAAQAAVDATVAELREAGAVVVTRRPEAARELSQLRVSATDATRLDADPQSSTPAARATPPGCAGTI